MACTNGQCEYTPTINRTTATTKDQRRYAQLWEEIELPKLLKETKT